MKIYAGAVCATLAMVAAFVLFGSGEPSPALKAAIPVSVPLLLGFSGLIAAVLSQKK